jgi:hypothetical protein
MDADSVTDVTTTPFCTMRLRSAEPGSREPEFEEIAA